MRKLNIVSKVKNAIAHRKYIWELEKKSLRNAHRVCGYTDISKKTIEMWRKKNNR